MSSTNVEELQQRLRGRGFTLSKKGAVYSVRDEDAGFTCFSGSLAEVNAFVASMLDEEDIWCDDMYDDLEY